MKVRKPDNGEGKSKKRPKKKWIAKSKKNGWKEDEGKEEIGTDYSEDENHQTDKKGDQVLCKFYQKTEMDLVEFVQKLVTLLG